MILSIFIILIFSYIKPIDTEIYKVEAQNISQTFKEEGTVVSNMERPVYSELNGIIEQLFVEEGQEIQKGEIIAQINTKDLEYQLEQLEKQKNSLISQEKMSEEDIRLQLGQLKGQLESIEGQEKQASNSPYEAQIAQQELVIKEVKRQLEIAQEQLNKNKQLFEQGLISKQELDNVENQVEQIQNQILIEEQTLNLIHEQSQPIQGTDQYFQGLKDAINVQIQILNEKLKGNSNSHQYYQSLIDTVDVQIDQLQEKNESGKLQATSDGVVKEIHLKEGAMATPQAPIVTIISPNNMEIETYLLTEDIIYVQEGMRVELIQKRRDGDITFEGTVKSIAPAAEEKVSALGLKEKRIKVKIVPGEDAPPLRPGYAIDVSFTIAEEKDKLAVPKEALFPVEDGDALFVVVDGKIETQKVKTGLETNDWIVIAEGLKEGELIIRNPWEEGIEEGKRVSSREENE